MIAGKLLCFVALLGVALAFGPGDYVPKSFYFIDQFGHPSRPVSVRSRRDIMDKALFRVRRGGGYATASSHASAGAGAGAGAGGGVPLNYGDYVPNFAQPDEILGQVQNLLNNIPGPSGAGAGSQAFAGSSSSASSGTHGAGPATGQSFGGLGAGHDVGYQGPVLFSRFGEAEGTGVHVSGEAQGNKAAFASSSSSIDNQGKIKYSVQSGKV